MSSAVRSRPASESEAGGATAEFAVVLPAVLLVCALTVGAALATAQQIRVCDAAAVAARAVGRGEDIGVGDMLAGLEVRSTRVESSGVLVCVAVEAGVQAAGLVEIPLHARSCAAADGR